MELGSPDELITNHVWISACNTAAGRTASCALIIMWLCAVFQPRVIND